MPLFVAQPKAHLSDSTAEFRFNLFSSRNFSEKHEKQEFLLTMPPVAIKVLPVA
jgi:hypothetical protein